MLLLFAILLIDWRSSFIKPLIELQIKNAPNEMDRKHAT